MSQIRIIAGDLTFVARLETDRAPRTCAAFETLLPLSAHLLQARWSGRAAWVPLGDLALGVGAENATGTPEPGEILLYPGGISETEILVPYGETRFACIDGPLEGNHFLTIVEGAEQLEELGRRVQWDGAQEISFTVLDLQQP